MQRFLAGVLLLFFSGVCGAQDLGADLTTKARPAYTRITDTANRLSANPAAGDAFIEAQFYHYPPPAVYYPPPEIYYPPPVATAPVWTAPVYPVCNYGYSAVCGTLAGNICDAFIVNYPTNLLSSCIGVWPIFQACMQIPGPPGLASVLSSGCHPSGMRCLCNFFGRYEAGYIL